MNRLPLTAALFGVSLFSAGAVAYAMYARDSAIRGWERAAKVEATLGDALGAFAGPRVRSDAGITVQASDREAAIAVMDLIYRRTKVGPENDQLTRWERYLQTVAGEITQLCGGMASAYDFALGAVGIPSRIVQLAAESYLNGERVGDTHVTVEALINGKWSVFDPTFNVYFNCADGREYLSISEMRDCSVTSRLTPMAERPVIPGRSVADYYIPYDNLLAAYSIAEVELDNASYPEESFPAPGWREEAARQYAR